MKHVKTCRYCQIHVYICRSFNFIFFPASFFRCLVAALQPQILLQRSLFEKIKKIRSTKSFGVFKRLRMGEIYKTLPEFSWDFLIPIFSYHPCCFSFGDWRNSHGNFLFFSRVKLRVGTKGGPERRCTWAPGWGFPRCDSCPWNWWWWWWWWWWCGGFCAISLGHMGCSLVLGSIEGDYMFKSRVRNAQCLQSKLGQSEDTAIFWKQWHAYCTCVRVPFHLCAFFLKCKIED